MIKKYWKAIAIVLVGVLAIATFYISSATAANQFPEFVFKKQSGDEQEVESISVDGSFGQNKGMVNESLQITADGSKYLSEQSFFDRFVVNYSPMISELVREHRNFMRGKDKYSSAFFENDDYLVFGDVNYRLDSFSPQDFKFAISILDKKSDKTTSFDLDVPNTVNIGFMDVLDVQVVGDELKIVTRSNSREGGTEIHVYSFNMTTNGLTNDQTLVAAPEQAENIFIDVMPLAEANKKAPHKYIVLNKIVREMVEQTEGSYTEKVKSKELLTYNYKTGKTETIKLPDELQEQSQIQSEESAELLDGSTIYLTNTTEKGVTVTPYDLESKSTGDAHTIQLAKSGDNVEPPLLEIKNGKLYGVTHVTNNDTTGVVAVVDLKSGKSLYQGEIVMKNPVKQFEDYNLYLYNLMIK